jgi:hypothetical protein
MPTGLIDIEWEKLPKCRECGEVLFFFDEIEEKLCDQCREKKGKY